MNINFYSLRMVKEKGTRYEAIKNEQINEPRKIYEIATEVLELDLLPEEAFYIFCLNTKYVLTGIHRVSEGTLNSSIVHPREVFKRALLNNSHSIILVHNHPSGKVTPSNEDISVTSRLVDAGKLLGVEVLDHIIVGDTYLSFKEKNLI